jgi:hypothetical protein
MAIQSERKIESDFLLKWGLVHFVGLFLAWIPYTDHVRGIFSYPPSATVRFTDIISVAVWGAVVGALLGIAQWLVIRRLIARSVWWIVVTTIGWILGLVIGTIFHIIALGAIGTGVVVGGIVGVLQFTVLRRYCFNSGWWVVASMAGWTLCLLIVSIGQQIIEPATRQLDFNTGAVTNQNFGNTLMIYLAGVLPLAVIANVVITGFTMKWLLSHPKQSVQVAAPVTQIN